MDPILHVLKNGTNDFCFAASMMVVEVTPYAKFSPRFMWRETIPAPFNDNRIGSVT